MTYDSFELILAAWSVLALAIFFVLLRVRAPYGRYGDVRFGPTVDNRLGWIAMELPAVLVMPALAVSGSTPLSSASVVALVLWEAHYVNRTLIFPFRQRSSGKRMPVAILASGMMFNSVNGFLNGYYFSHFAQHLDDGWFADPRFAVGLIVFVIGLMVNWRADHILLRLRKPGEAGYRVPAGRLFDRISCPNYAGEILEWCGFAILTWSPAAATFALWTVANLVPRALSHHSWYRRQFPDYPADRKAIVPWLL